MPRLRRAAGEWEPRQETVPVHAWLHPWLPHLGAQVGGGLGQQREGGGHGREGGDMWQISPPDTDILFLQPDLTAPVRLLCWLYPFADCIPYLCDIFFDCTRAPSLRSA